MKRFVRNISFILLSLVAGVNSVFAQANAAKERSTESSGIGINREEAINDALRNAIGQVAGVELRSETRVENFDLVSDAIATNINGYIAGYEITRESRKDELFEIFVKARVSTNSLKADAQWLARMVGGIRFLVMYDDRKVPREQRADLDFAVERVNQFLSSKRYRYIEKSRFETLRKQAMNMMEARRDTSEISYVQSLAIMADAQFVIVLKGYHAESREGAFGTRTQSRLDLDIKTYDNCTAEGLGTVVLASNWKSGSLGNNGNMRSVLTEAIDKDMDKLMLVFNQYVGDWVNNGTPFELRFYGIGGFRDLRDLRQRIQSDKNFGGQMEIVGAEGYQRLNITFRNQPADLADKILSIADDIPTLRAQRLDVKLIYGRQISFAPTGQRIKELEDLGVGTNSSTTTTPSTPAARPTVSKPATTKTAPVRRPAPAKKAPSKPATKTK